MQQPQRRLKSREKVLPGHLRFVAVGIEEVRLYPLDVPIAKIAPEELIDRLGRFVKAVVGQRIVDYLNGFRKSAEEPAIDDGYVNRYRTLLRLLRIRSFFAYVGRGEFVQRNAALFKLIQIHE